MRIRRWISVLRWLPLAILLSSCSEPPEENIQSVTDAFEELRAANAAGYAPEAFGKAEKAYADAMAEVESQKGKFALTRSYDRANDLLAEATEAIVAAKTAAEDHRAEMQQGIAERLQDAKVTFAAVEEGMTKLRAPRAKLEKMRRGFEEAGASLKQAEDAFQSGDFLTAQAKLEDAQALLAQVQDDMEASVPG